MELWNRSVTAAMFILGALVLAAFGLSAFMSRYPSGSTVAKQHPLPPRVPTTRTLPKRTSDAIALRTLELTRAKDRISDLEARLKQERQQSNRLREAVEYLQKHSSSLEAERDASIDWIRDLMTEEPTTESSATDSAEAASSVPPSEGIPGANQAEVDELRAQVAELRGLLVEVEAAAESDTAEIRREVSRLQQLASDVLSQSGAAPVPALIEMLESRDARTRLWAARMLKAVGPDADTAIAALMLALGDSDPQVRAAAQEALDAIHE